MKKGIAGLELEGYSNLLKTFTAVAGQDRAREIMYRLLTILNKYGNPILNQLDENTRIELSENSFELMSYSPITFYVAHNDKKQILHGRINVYNNNSSNNLQDYSTSSIASQSKSTQRVGYDSVIINAIPFKVVKYEDPTNTETKYEIDFETALGNNFHIEPKSLKDILEELKLRGLVYKVRHAEEALPAILNAYQRDGKVIVKREVETPGFYLVNNSIVANKIEQPSKTLTVEIYLIARAH